MQTTHLPWPPGEEEPERKRRRKQVAAASAGSQRKQKEREGESLKPSYFVKRVHPPSKPLSFASVLARRFAP